MTILYIGIFLASGDIRKFLSNPVISIFLLLWFFGTSITMLRGKSVGQKDEFKTSWYLFFNTWVSACIIFAVYDYTHISRISPKNTIFTYFGISLITIGAFISIIAVNTLGKFYATKVVIQEGHKLITTGIYKYIRHPIYLAVSLQYLGIPLIFSSIYGLIFILIDTIAFISLRIRIEEKMLVREFGEEYINYMKNTKKIIPFLF